MKQLLISFAFIFYTYSVEIEFSSERSLLDKELSIAVGQAPPFKEVRIEAHSKDSEGNKWLSWGVFWTDKNGCLDLQRVAPKDGTYKGIDGMGLFWSMQPMGSSVQVFHTDKNEFPVTFQVIIDKEIVATKSITRLKTFSSTQRIEVRENGIVGTLFIPPSDKKLPVVIMLNGSDGGINEFGAKVLASNGFSVLTLGYFGMEGLPNVLENIPLEYFKIAIDWVKNRCDLDGSKVGIFGGSRGGELALILGTVYPELIQVIVAGVPASVFYGGFPDENKPAWTLNGKPLGPMAPIDEGFIQGTGEITDPIRFTPNFLHFMKSDKEAYKRAFIPVEKIQCPVLLISGGDDQMWPSDIYCQQIKNHLHSECKHLSYPKAGHLCFNVPFQPGKTSTFFNSSDNQWYLLGGSEIKNELACRKSWRKLIDFFNTTLKEKI